ncbi:hypothetical protein ACGFN1_42775, partial [Streptomyces sp. NPDC048685]
DDRETVMSGSAGGRAEQDLSRQAPHRAADPTSWMTGYRRLNHRYERKPGNYLAFLGLAAALCCYKRLLKLTM